MKNKDILVTDFGDRTICIKGIGKMFYQNGFPISMSISELKKKNIEVSLFHVADECLKNGWSPKTTFNKLKADLLEDNIDKNISFNLDILYQFCYETYENQREMIFFYLYKMNSKDILNDKKLFTQFKEKFLNA